MTHSCHFVRVATVNASSNLPFHRHRDGGLLKFDIGSSALFPLLCSMFSFYPLTPASHSLENSRTPFYYRNV